MKHTLYNEAMAYPDMRILVNCDDRLGDHVIVSLNDILEFVKKNEYSSDIESYDIRDVREEEMIKCAWCGKITHTFVQIGDEPMCIECREGLTVHLREQD